MPVSTFSRFLWRFRLVDAFAVVGGALADVGSPVSLGPLGPAFGGTNAYTSQVSQHRGGQIGGQSEAGGVAACMGVDAVAVQTDAEQDVRTPRLLQAWACGIYRDRMPKQPRLLHLMQ